MSTNKVFQSYFEISSDFVDEVGMCDFLDSDIVDHPSLNKFLNIFFGLSQCSCCYQFYFESIDFYTKGKRLDSSCKLCVSMRKKRLRFDRTKKEKQKKKKLRTRDVREFGIVKLYNSKDASHSIKKLIDMVVG